MPTSVESLKSQESSRKTSTSASCTMLKLLTMWITTNCGIFFKGIGRPNHLTCLVRNLYAEVKKQNLEPYMEQQTGLKLRKNYVKAVHYHPAYLTSMQSISCKMPGWMKHKMESRLPGEISITSDTQMTPPLWQRVRRN